MSSAASATTSSKRHKGATSGQASAPHPPHDAYHGSYGHAPPGQRRPPYGAPPAPYGGPPPPPPGGYGMWGGQYGSPPPPPPQGWGQGNGAGSPPPHMYRGAPPPPDRAGGPSPFGPGFRGGEAGGPASRGRGGKSGSGSRSVGSGAGAASTSGDIGAPPHPPPPPPPHGYQGGGWGGGWPQQGWGGHPSMWHGRAPGHPVPRGYPPNHPPMYGTSPARSVKGGGDAQGSPETMNIYCGKVNEGLDVDMFARGMGQQHDDDDGMHSISGGASSSKDKGRGSYKCGRCGVPKKGHVCPYQPKMSRRPGEPLPEMRNAAMQVEMDEFMTLRRLNLKIQGFPESYASESHMEDMVVGEARPMIPPHASASVAGMEQRNPEMTDGGAAPHVPSLNQAASDIRGSPLRESPAADDPVNTA